MRNRFALASLLLAVASLPAAAQTGTWTTAGNMNVGRYNHVAALLPNGKVLVAGGRDHNGAVTSTSETYDPQTGGWTVVGSMSTPRVHAEALTLTTGKVLVMGGFDASNQDLAIAELFDPATDQWTPTGSMNEPRYQSKAALLQNGSVLVLGGWRQQTNITVQSAEIYDPSTGVWTTVANMNGRRAAPFSALLNDGRVVGAGGLVCCPYQNLITSEVFSPSTGAWTSTGNLTITRGQGTTTLLSDGSVFAAGGLTGTQPNWPAVASSERFDPATNAWSARAPMAHARQGHTATLLLNGRVLVAGGGDQNGVKLSSAEVYDPVTDSWLPAGVISTARWAATATRLQDGRVLVAGGQATAAVSGSRAADIYSDCFVSTYCTSGTTTHGCVPTISGTGAPRAGASSGFTIAVNGVEGAQSGLLFYGLSGPVAFPWGTSTSFMCVKSPLERTPVQNSGGNYGACDGVLSLDWNLYVASNPFALGNPFVGGEQVRAQAWFRDPPSPKTTNLSNGLLFSVCP